MALTVPREFVAVYGRPNSDSWKFKLDFKNAKYKFVS